MDSILTPRTKGFNSKDCKNLKIGKWSAYVTPDKLVVWTKKKGFFGKDSSTKVWATPHYEKEFEVCVQVVTDGEPILWSTFALAGRWIESDLKTYMVEMKEILNILK